jgi:hypothetical protein
MAKGSCNASANYFVLFVLLLFFMLIYASFLRLPSKEYYANELLDPKETQFMQGINIPLKYEPTLTDISDPVKPPECCIDSPYSCDRGCVCMTDKQYDYLDGRGKNHSKNACTFEDSGF